jgi:amino acid permease
MKLEKKSVIMRYKKKENEEINGLPLQAWCMLFDFWFGHAAMLKFVGRVYHSFRSHKIWGLVFVVVYIRQCILFVCLFIFSRSIKHTNFVQNHKRLVF